MRKEKDFALRIAALMGPHKRKLREFSAAYLAGDRSAEAKISELVDRVNILKPPRGKKIEDIEIAPPSHLTDDFLQSKDYPFYRKKAEKLLLEGSYVGQFIYAGAATRLLKDIEAVLGRKPDPKECRMYRLDLWKVLAQVQKAGRARLGSVLDEKMAGTLIDHPMPHSAEPLGMGPRQILAYKRLIERLAARHGLSSGAARRRQKLVFHISEEIQKEVLADFVKKDFYGFEPSNIFFITQPVFKGYRFSRAGAIVPAPRSAALPYGHGYATAQLVSKEAFSIDAKGRRKNLPRSALDTLIRLDRKDDFVLGTHRVNDSTKFASKSVVDLDGLALGLELLERGHGIIIDLVGNPGGQKGGNNIRFRGEERSFLIETSNAKGSSYLSSLLDRAAKTQAPYNAFRLLTRPAVYKKLLGSGLRYNLRFRDGYFYLEAVTGDMTQMPASRSTAIQKKGELIHDFKQLKDLPDALFFAARQDSGE